MSDLEDTFAEQWRTAQLPEPVRDHAPWRPHRGFEVDFALPDRKIGVEIEGGIWHRGGHSTGAGISRDIDKHNLALFTGWRILRIAPQQVKNGEGITMAAGLINGNTSLPISGEWVPPFLLQKPKERKRARRRDRKKGTPRTRRRSRDQRRVRPSRAA